MISGQVQACVIRRIMPIPEVGGHGMKLKFFMAFSPWIIKVISEAAWEQNRKRKRNFITLTLESTCQNEIYAIIIHGMWNSCPLRGLDIFIFISLPYDFIYFQIWIYRWTQWVIHSNLKILLNMNYYNNRKSANFIGHVYFASLHYHKPWLSA